jgi:hypothetical protein
MDGLLSDIHHEMDDLSAVFRRSTADITPESLLNFDFEKDVTEICRQHTPKLRRILMAAAQTPRAAKENTVKNPEPVVQLTPVITLANHVIARYDDPGATSQDPIPKQ